MGLFDGLFGGGGGDIADSAARAAWQKSQAINYAVNTGHDLLKEGHSNAMSYLSPWNVTGKDALSVYASLLGIPGYETTYSPENYLRKTPGYLWQLGQGQRALDSSAASRGMLLSGPQRQASQQYGQNIASTYYDKLMNQLSGLSSTGLQAGGVMAPLEEQLAQNRTGLQFKMAEGTGNALDQVLQGELAQDAKKQSGLGNILGLVGSLGGLLSAPFTGGTSLLGMGTNALSGLFGGGGGGGGGGGYTPTWNNTLSNFYGSSYGS